MAPRRTPGPTTAGSRASGPSTRPVRRRSDSTLLYGVSRPLTLGSVGAVVVGVLLALTQSSLVAPVAFALSSVVAVGLLGAALRTDTAARHDYTPDRTGLSRRVIAGVVLLAIVGTGLSAWTIALDLAR